MKLEPWQPQESQLQDTILVLKQRQRASLAQIRKRLELNNGDDILDEAKTKMLSSSLNNSVLKGKVEKNGGVYKLARCHPAVQGIGVPGRRRRAFPHAPANAITNCDAVEATDITVGDAIAAGVVLSAANATAATTSCDAAKVTASGGNLSFIEFDTGAGGRCFICNAKSNPPDARKD